MSRSRCAAVLQEAIGSVLEGIRKLLRPRRFPVCREPDFPIERLEDRWMLAYSPCIDSISDQYTTTNSELNVCVSFSDSDGDETFQATIEWESGQTSCYTLGSSMSFTGCHTYFNSGSYTPTVTVTDNNSESSYTSFNVYVSAPSSSPYVSISGDSSVAVGSSYTLGVSANTTDSHNLSSLSILWGDGSSSSDSLYNTSISSSYYHTYTVAGSYNIQVGVSDDGSDSNSSSTTVSACSYAPSVSIGGPTSAYEGTCDTWCFSVEPSGSDTISSASVNWGDGTVDSISGGTCSSQQISHTFPDGDHTYTITVNATSSSGGTASSSMDVPTANVAPTMTIEGGDFNNGCYACVDAGECYTFSFSATDVSADHVVQWVLNWGDGECENIDTSDRTIARNHIYDGYFSRYDIIAWVIDDDGVYSTSLMVKVPDFTTDVCSAESVEEGQEYTLSLLPRAGYNSIYQWQVAWGDGQSDTVDGSATQLTHIYSQGGCVASLDVVAYDYTVGSSCTSMQVCVTEAPLCLSVCGSSTVEDGLVYSLYLNADDPGHKLTRWVIGWGDYTPDETYDGSVTVVRHLFPSTCIGPCCWVTESFYVCASGVDGDGLTYTANGSALTVTTAAPSQHVPPAPATPEDLVVTAVADRYVRLSWRDQDDAYRTGYRIDQQIGSGSWQTLGWAAAGATNYTLPLPDAPSGTYTWHVTAYGQSGSSQAAAVSLTPSQGMPKAPTKLRVSVASRSGATLAWNHSGAGAGGFVIERSLNGDDYVQVGTVAANLRQASVSIAANNTYQFRVRAYQGTYKSAAASLLFSTGAPSGPSELSVESMSATGATLVWSAAPSDARRFVIECITDGRIWQAEPTDTCFTVPGLFSAATSYTFSVWADNGLASSDAASTTVSAPALPTAPANLTVTALTASSVSLSWTDSADSEDGFEIEVSQNGGIFGPLTRTDDPDVTTATVAHSFDVNSTYQFRVRAYNSYGRSSFSDSGVSAPVEVPALPTGVSASSISSSSANVSWTNSSATVAAFRIEWRRQGDSEWNHTDLASSQVGTVSTTMSADFEPQTIYQFRVAAANAAGTSSPSSVYTAPATGAWPVAPGSFSATANTSGIVHLSWTYTTVGNSIVIERRAAGEDWPASPIAMIADSNTSWDEAAALDPGTAYFYRVQAVNGSLASYSRTAQVAVRPGAPTPERISAYCVDLTWSGAAPAEGASYRVYRGTSTEFPLDAAHRIADELTDTAYSNTTVDPAIGGYRYWITVVTPDGHESLASEPSGASAVGAFAAPAASGAAQRERGRLATP